MPEISEWVKKHFSEIEKETESKISDEKRFLWLIHGDLCNDIVGSLADVLDKEEESRSMLVLRLFELQKTLLWLNLCANYGAYRPLIRELRFFLESFMQGLYMDEKYSTKNMEEKWLLLHKNETRLYGFKLIKKLNIDDRDDLLDLYHRLSNYVHGSAIELLPIMEGKVHDRFVACFDHDLFYECLNYTNRTLDWMFYMILKKYPQTTKILKKDHNTIGWLTKLGYEKTIRIIKDLGESHRQTKLNPFFK